METNEDLQLAFDLVEHTGVNIFLTGKAGTGKTTFLRRLKEVSPKRMVVVAPTGVAAINAGGVTIHSFFQLSFEPFVPGVHHDDKKKYQIGQEKLAMIRSLSLLVIDEISMVRADVLDAIDDVLRRIRHNSLPFGGVQLLMIGDLQQLPPVVTDNEASLLASYYPSNFFFHSKALNQIPYCCVELKKVYRQSDDKFIAMLNAVREGRTSDEILSQLNARYIPEFEPSESEHYIRLTTHNEKAKHINEDKLAQLDNDTFTYSATVTGNFPSQNYPTDDKLQLKVGAQVMFVKNDPSPNKAYYNGKIGEVIDLTNNSVKVQFPDGDVVDALPLKWSNTKYELNKQTNEIEEKEDGSFTQFPLKLAWAITIHKSQGLTFDKVILDASGAFAHGQVYVALSRCKTFEGLVLSSLIPRSALINEYEVEHFTSNIHEPSPTELDGMKRSYELFLMQDQFDMNSLRFATASLVRLYDEFFYKQYSQELKNLKYLQKDFESNLFVVGEKFKLQLQQLQNSGADNIQDRVIKGSIYFLTELNKFESTLRMQLVSPDMVTAKDIKKRLENAIDTLDTELRIKKATLKSSKSGFDVQTYLKDKAVAAIGDLQKGESAAKKKSESSAKAPVSILYPDFFQALRQWRKNLAEERKVPPYVIAHDSLLIEITRRRPRTIEELKAIKGFGESRLVYAADLLLLANDDTYFKKMNEAALHQNETVEDKKEPKVPTFEQTLKLWESGKTVEEIAKERGLTVATIQGHLCRYISAGQIPVDKVMNPQDVKAIDQIIAAANKNTLTEIFNALGGTYTFGEIRMVLSQPKYTEALKETDNTDVFD